MFLEEHVFFGMMNEMGNVWNFNITEFISEKKDATIFKTRLSLRERAEGHLTHLGACEHCKSQN